MKTATQLSVFLKNEPGVLASICNALSERKINILGMSVSDAIDHAVLRLVVNKPEQTAHLLGDRGMLVLDTQVLQLSLANNPGTLGKVARKLAKAKVNIDYAYAASGPGVSHQTIFLKVSDPRKAARVLKGS